MLEMMMWFGLLLMLGYKSARSLVDLIRQRRRERETERQRDNRLIREAMDQLTEDDWLDRIAWDWEGRVDRRAGNKKPE